DEVIVFHSLSRGDVKSIVDLLIRRVREQLKAKDVEIELTDQAKELLAEKGYDPSLGARPLRRTIQRLVEDPLSEKLLWKEFKDGAQWPQGHWASVIRAERWSVPTSSSAGRPSRPRHRPNAGTRRPFG